MNKLWYILKSGITIAILELAEFCLALFVAHLIFPKPFEWEPVIYFCAVLIGGFSIGVWVAIRQLKK